MLKKLKFIARRLKITTKLLGPKNIINTHRIEIDITYFCNLACVNCNRSCRQAPTQEHMTIGQIKKFIKESISLNKKWEQIRIVGGEPTLHKDIYPIVNLLSEYRDTFSSETKITLVTNGFGKKVKEVLRNIKTYVDIESSEKESSEQYFTLFNKAPKDEFVSKFMDYSNACWIPSKCGMGLTPYGYYPCSVAGSIDRILGIDAGLKNMQANEKELMLTLKTFCKYCGHFRAFKVEESNKELFSKTWKEAYNNYEINKPNLSYY